MKTISLIIIFIILYLGQPLISQNLNAKKNELLVFDGHTHIGLSFKGKKIILSDYKYYSDRKVNVILFNLPVDRSTTSDLLKRIEIEISKIKILTKKNDSVKLAISERDYYNNYFRRKKSLGLAIEYFKGIFNQNENTIKKYYEMGIRMICLINNSYDRLFISEGKTERLNNFGKKVIKKMNKYGVLIDITHLNDNQKFKVIKFSKAPVIASHSNPRGPAPSSFNVSDRVIKALKEHGGLFLVSFNKNDLYPDNKNAGNGVRGVLTHLKYIKEIMGIDQIGIGTDLQAAGKYVPTDLQSKDSFLKIVIGLKNSGYSKETIQKIMGGNLLKLLKNQEK